MEAVLDMTLQANAFSMVARVEVGKEKMEAEQREQQVLLILGVVVAVALGLME